MPPMLPPTTLTAAAILTSVLVKRVKGAFAPSASLTGEESAIIDGDLELHTLSPYTPHPTPHPHPAQSYLKLTLY